MQQRGSEGMAGTLPSSYYEVDVIKFSKINHEHGVARMQLDDLKIIKNTESDR